MLKNEIIKMTLKVAVVILLAVAVILAALSFINYSYVLGWLVSGIASISSYILGILLINKMQMKGKTKRVGF